MVTKILDYHHLHIEPKDLYEQMGYGETPPHEDVMHETAAMTAEISALLRPQYCYFITKGELDTERHILHAMGRQLQVGRIISRQLKGSSAYAFFVATAGIEFERFQQQLSHESDMVRMYLADAIGSVIAEKAADRMEENLQASISGYGWQHTNRFSPGYCGWHVSQQQQLFPMFGIRQPCGVQLTPSSLMVPIKSVSGVVGLGQDVRKLEYTCGLCNYKDCYKRRRKEKAEAGATQAK